MMDWIGYIATLITSVCLIPQVISVIKSKDLSAISLHYFGLLGISNVLWIIYSHNKSDIPIFIVNLISYLCCTFIVSLKILRERQIK